MKNSPRLTAEQRHVEAELKDQIICERCGATLSTFAEKCTAGLLDPCPGYERIENAKQEFQRNHPYNGKGL